MGTLEELRARLGRAAILLDFDGTLAPIASRPEDAAPLPAAATTLASLAQRARVVAVITGRPASFVRRVLPVPTLEVIGVYGAEAAAPLDDGVIHAVTTAAAAVPGATVEDKRVSVAVHVRGVDDRAAIAALEETLRAIAADHDLVWFAGKRVIEIARPGPRKGGAVTQILDRHTPEAALYAGDDLEDADAFAALEPLRDDGAPVLRIAVRSSETPDALLAVADLSVEGPEGLLTVLAGL